MKRRTSRWDELPQSQEPEQEYSKRQRPQEVDQQTQYRNSSQYQESFPRRGSQIRASFERFPRDSSQQEVRRKRSWRRDSSGSVRRESLRSSDSFHGSDSSQRSSWRNDRGSWGGEEFQTQRRDRSGEREVRPLQLEQSRTEQQNRGVFSRGYRRDSSQNLWRLYSKEINSLLSRGRPEQSKVLRQYFIKNLEKLIDLDPSELELSLQVSVIMNNASKFDDVIDDLVNGWERSSKLDNIFTSVCKTQRIDSQSFALIFNALTKLSYQESRNDKILRFYEAIKRERKWDQIISNSNSQEIANIFNALAKISDEKSRNDKILRFYKDIDIDISRAKWDEIILNPNSQNIANIFNALSKITDQDQANRVITKFYEDIERQKKWYDIISNSNSQEIANIFNALAKISDPGSRNDKILGFYKDISREKWDDIISNSNFQNIANIIYSLAKKNVIEKVDYDIINLFRQKIINCIDSKEANKLDLVTILISLIEEDGSINRRFDKNFVDRIIDEYSKVIEQEEAGGDLFKLSYNLTSRLSKRLISYSSHQKPQISQDSSKLEEILLGFESISRFEDSAIVDSLGDQAMIDQNTSVIVAGLTNSSSELLLPSQESTLTGRQISLYVRSDLSISRTKTSSQEGYENFSTIWQESLVEAEKDKIRNSLIIEELNNLLAKSSLICSGYFFQKMQGEKMTKTQISLQ